MNNMYDILARLDQVDKQMLTEGDTDPNRNPQTLTYGTGDPGRDTLYQKKMELARRIQKNNPPDRDAGNRELEQELDDLRKQTELKFGLGDTQSQGIASVGDKLKSGLKSGLKAMGRTVNKSIDADGGQRHNLPAASKAAVSKAAAEVGSRQGYFKEDDMEEGNEFSGELAEAKASGAKEFEVDGRTYPVKEAKKARPDFLDVDGDGDKKEPFKKAVADRDRTKKPHNESLRLVREEAIDDQILRVYHDREYQEYHVCVMEGNTVVSREFAHSSLAAQRLARAVLEARGSKEKAAWPGTAEYRKATDTETLSDFRKKHAPSVMKSPEARKELEKMDTEYEAGKKNYGRDQEDDDEEEGKKKDKPAGEKRGRGRPKGSKRAIGAKGPSGRSKLLTREQQLDEISSDLALTAARRAEKKGQAYADDNLSSGPQIGYEYMQQAKRLQRGADKRRERERDQEVQAALSPAKRRRMTKEEQLDEVSVGDQVTIDFPGSQAHGKSGRVVSIQDGMAKVAVGGATGTQTKMQWDSGAFGPRGMEVDLGRGQRGGGTHTQVPLMALKRRGQGVSEVAKWRDPDREGQTWARDDASGPNDPRPGKIPLTKTGQRDANTWADRGSGTASDPLAWKAAQKKAAGTLTPDDVKFGVKKNFPRYEEQDVSEDYDRDEYDEEGEMAQSQSRSIEDAAKELQSILDADENLPEWVQKKITLAQEYIDSARDYLKANRPEDSGMPLPEANYSAKKGRAGKDIGRRGKNFNKIAKGAAQRYGSKAAGKRVAGAVLKNLRRGTKESAGEEQIDEKFASQAQARLMHATAGGADTGVSKKVAREFIKKSHGQQVGKLPEKVKKEQKQDPVEETTTAGSVATAPAAGGKKSKGGMQFGKGIYEAQIAESFDAELDRVLAEGTTITINNPDTGEPTTSITGTGEDAVELGQLLSLAGLFSSSGYQHHGADTMCDECGAAGMHEAGCSRGEMVEEQDLSNSADNTETMSMDYMLTDIAGGANGPKRQVNPNNIADNSLAMTDLAQKSAGQLNLGAIAEDVEQDDYQRMLDLYRKIS